MKQVLLPLLVLLLVGCLSTQSATNPVKKAPAPKVVDPRVVEEAPFIDEASTVDKMKEMFLAQKMLNEAILQMATELTPEELKELNAWLAQFGVQIQRKKNWNPGHNPDEVF